MFFLEWFVHSVIYMSNKINVNKYKYIKILLKFKLLLYFPQLTNVHLEKSSQNSALAQLNNQLNLKNE